VHGYRFCRNKKNQQALTTTGSAASQQLRYRLRDLPKQINIDLGVDGGGVDVAMAGVIVLFVQIDTVGLKKPSAINDLRVQGRVARTENATRW